MDPKAHWEKIYRTKRPNEVSWYRPHLEVSLQLIEEAAPNRVAQIIDVGGGESTLVDDLLTRGYRNLSVLDVSLTALDVAKERVGARVDRVKWLCGDVTTFAFAPHKYDATTPTRLTANLVTAFNWLNILPSSIKHRLALFNNSPTATAIFLRELPNTRASVATLVKATTNAGCPSTAHD